MIGDLKTGGGGGIHGFRTHAWARCHWCGIWGLQGTGWTRSESCAVLKVVCAELMPMQDCRNQSRTPPARNPVLGSSNITPAAQSNLLKSADQLSQGRSDVICLGLFQRAEIHLTVWWRRLKALSLSEREVNSVYA